MRFALRAANMEIRVTLQSLRQSHASEFVLQIPARGILVGACRTARSLELEIWARERIKSYYVLALPPDGTVVEHLEWSACSSDEQPAKMSRRPAGGSEQA